MLKQLACAAALAIAAPAPGQAPPAYPAEAPPEPDAIPLYANEGSATSEDWVRFLGRDYAVRNVTRPTITPFLPDPKKATGAAVVVAPGGAFMLLALEHEGWKVARWLADHGVAAFVLKYRVIPTPREEKAAGAFMGARMAEAIAQVERGGPPTIREPRATEDALAALKLVRAGAAKWGVDPKRVGMMGFSAGAMTTLNAVLAPDRAARPAFAGYIYGPMNAVTVPADAPPMFSAIALDDELFRNTGFGLVDSWRKAGRPIEFHGYERGRHGFGTGVPGTTTTLMLDQFHAWMGSRGLLARTSEMGK